MTILYYTNDMELQTVAAPWTGPANNMYVCRDLRSAVGEQYVLLAIHDRDCEKKLLAVLAKSKDPSVFSFARNDEIIYGFPWREPRRFSSFASQQATTGYQREQTALALVMACIVSELPPPLLYLVLTQNCVSITKENEIYFTPPQDLSQLDPETDETACTVRCAEMVRALLSPEPEEPVFLKIAPPPQKRRGLFRRRPKSGEDGQPEAEPEPKRSRRRKKTADAGEPDAKAKRRADKKKKKKPLRSCELIEKKCRSRSYSSLAELYRDIQLTALPEKKPTLTQRIRGFWVRNRDTIFRVLLVFCIIAVIVAIIMILSQILFGDIPLLRLFRHCFDKIGTEFLNTK